MRFGLAFFFLLGIFGCAGAAYRTNQSTSARAISEAFAKKAMVSTQGRAATAAAQEILKKGGNAIDAAIAASFAISVERPHSTGLGGGGFMLYREASTGKIYAIDFRERAPARASRNMYLDSAGNVIPHASTDGIRAVATPSLIAGLLEIHHRFGSLPLKTLIQPAIDLAENGFEVYPTLAHALQERRDVLAHHPESKKIFLHADGSPYREGEILVQKDLAKTLRILADSGPGPINWAIADESKREKGVLELHDLETYQVKWREPVIGDYQGYRIVSMPPPSSGGAHVIEILNILEPYRLKEEGFQSANGIHLIASALQLAFADRAEYMGDPDFVKVPLARLTSKQYAEQERTRINPEKHTPSDEIRAGNLRVESTSTTHFAIMDAKGNVVSSTQTINGYFGSGVTVPGTGIVLNNEMDDFSAKPGAPNLFGAVGGDANAIAPGKTPLSSMAPTLVFKGDTPVMALGAPGGTRIISCVAETLINRIGYGLSLYDSVNAIRFHHQWKPDLLEIDSPGPGPAVIAQLKNMGYTISMGEDAVPCRVMAVERSASGFTGVSDPIDHGSAAGF